MRDLRINEIACVNGGITGDQVLKGAGALRCIALAGDYVGQVFTEIRSQRIDETTILKGVGILIYLGLSSMLLKNVINPVR